MDEKVKFINAYFFVGLCFAYLFITSIMFPCVKIFHLKFVFAIIISHEFMSQDRNQESELGGMQH